MSFLFIFIHLDNYKWWSKTVDLGGCCRKVTKSLNVEITSYALLALLTAQKDSDCLPVLKWLLSQRNDRGGFEGTQDTVVGLQALAHFASKFAVNDIDIKIGVKSREDNAEKHFAVNKENSLVLQSEKLSTKARNIDVNASGHGFALLEVAYRYNINEKDPEPAFKLNVKPELKTSELIDLHISTW